MAHECSIDHEQSRDHTESPSSSFHIPSPIEVNPTRRFRVYKLPKTDFTMVGYSRSRDKTFFSIPQLKICLDAGYCRGRLGDHIFLTHGHADHSYDLHYMATHQFNCAIHCPHEIVDHISNYCKSFVEFSGNKQLPEKPNWNFTINGCKPGTIIPFNVAKGDKPPKPYKQALHEVLTNDLKKAILESKKMDGDDCGNSKKNGKNDSNNRQMPFGMDGSDHDVISVDQNGSSTSQDKNIEGKSKSARVEEGTNINNGKNDDELEGKGKGKDKGSNNKKKKDLKSSVISMNYRAIAFECFHSVPCIGFQFEILDKRMKKEYIKLKQDPNISKKELGKKFANLRKQGIDFMEHYWKKLFVYVGDTSIKVFENNIQLLPKRPQSVLNRLFSHKNDRFPSIDNNENDDTSKEAKEEKNIDANDDDNDDGDDDGDVVVEDCYKSIIIECTFLDDFNGDNESLGFKVDSKEAMKIKEKLNIHITWSYLKPFILEFREVTWILIHFSCRYKENDIFKFFQMKEKEIIKETNGKLDLSNVVVWACEQTDGSKK